MLGCILLAQPNSTSTKQPIDSSRIAMEQNNVSKRIRIILGTILLCGQLIQPTFSYVGYGATAGRKGEP